MENFTYYNPVKMLFGPNQLDNLTQEILPFGKKILFVYGRNHLKATGVYDRIVNMLKNAGIEYFELSGVQPNPRINLIRQGIEIAKKEKIDFVLAVGGGSVADTAKAVAMGALIDYDIWEAYENMHRMMHGSPDFDPKYVPSACLPVGVVMTKPATGSDFDYTTVATNWETHEKLMITNRVMVPKFSIIDSELVKSLPQDELKYGISDIMSHYMEQYFTVTQNTEVLDRVLAAGMRSTMENGLKAVKGEMDTTTLGNLLYVASWACSDQNMAGNMATWDSHMIEHEITAAIDLNHGHGMAIVFRGWLKYVMEKIPQKLASFAQDVWGIERNGRSDLQMGLEAISKLEEFYRTIGIPITLKEVGIDRSMLPDMAKKAVRFGALGAIKTLNEEDVLKIYESVYEENNLGKLTHAEAIALIEPFYNLFRADKRDWDKGMAVLDDNWCAYYSNNQYRDKKATREFLTGFFAMIPDINVEIKEVCVEGDTIAVRSELSGTPNKDFLVPYSGKSFSIMTVDINRFKDGKLTRLYHSEDWQTAIEQLSTKKEEALV